MQSTIVFLYDKFGASLDSIDYIEMQWDRKIFEPGDFELYIAEDDYNFKAKYVRLEWSYEYGIIQKIVREENEHGRFITVKGFFLDKLLDYAIIHDAYALQSDQEVGGAIMFAILLRNACTQYTPTLNDFLKNHGVGPTRDSSYGQTDFLRETTIKSGTYYPCPPSLEAHVGESVGEVIRNAMKVEGAGMMCRPRFTPFRDMETETPYLGLEIRPVLKQDRSNKVVFGKHYNNISKIEYSIDESNCASNIVALQKIPENVLKQSDFKWTKLIRLNTDGEAHTFIYEVLKNKNKPTKMGNCNPTIFMETQISEINKNNEIEVRDLMREEAKKKALEHKIERKVLLDVQQNNFIYRKDYDLGNICGIELPGNQGFTTAQITEVHEVHRKNQVEIQIVME